jgi:hypothetical protein
MASPNRRASERITNMPIENRNLEPGTVLTARYKKVDRTCAVVQTDDGVRYRLDDGTEHRSPSSAGKAAMDGVACNGWRFWSIEGTEAPKREPKADKPAKAKKEPAAKKPARATGKAKSTKSKKSKAMRAAATGDSFGCGVCPETFATQKKAVAHTLTHTG